MKKIIIILTIIIAMSPNALAIEIPNNAIGVLYIPCLNVKMPVYMSETDHITHKQAVIDNEQSALIDNWGVAYDIGDHAFSDDGNGNEWNIQKIFSGAYAWFYTNEAHYFLECYMTAKTEYDGNEYVNGRLLTPCSSYDIMLSCCAEDSNHHFVAVFRRLGKYDE